MDKFLKIGQMFRFSKEKVRDKKVIDGYPNFSFYANSPPLFLKTNFLRLAQ